MLQFALIVCSGTLAVFFVYNVGMFVYAVTTK